MNDNKFNIITVIGNPNTGKTTLIRNLYKFFCNQGALIRYYEAAGAHFEDFNAIVIWKEKVIALCSIGDYADEEEETDDYFWPLTYVKNGIEIAKRFKAEILINTRSLNNMTENDYKNFLQKELGEKDYIPCNMESEIFQIECIKQNQKNFDFIINEIMK